MNMQENKIIHLISSLPRIEPSEDFSRRVMSRIMMEKPSLADRILKFFLWNSGSVNSMSGIVSLRPKTRVDCAVCYMMTGSFYLILGAVLMAGLKLVSVDLLVNGKMQMLPWFSFFVSLWLMVLAIVMLIGGGRAIVGTKVGTMVFIALVLAGVIQFSILPKSPAVYMSMVMSLTSIFMGLLLYYQVSVFSKATREDSPHGIKL